MSSAASASSASTSRLWLSFGLGLAVLGITGIVFARVERLGSFRGTLAVLGNLALGVVLIGLKVLVVH